MIYEPSTLYQYSNSIQWYSLKTIQYAILYCCISKWYSKIFNTVYHAFLVILLFSQNYTSTESLLTGQLYWTYYSGLKHLSMFWNILNSTKPRFCNWPFFDSFDSEFKHMYQHITVSWLVLINYWTFGMYCHSNILICLHTALLQL